MANGVPDRTLQPTAGRRRPAGGIASHLTAFVLFLLLSAQPASAADLPAAQKLFRTGDYAGCLDACKKGIEENRWLEGWWLLKVRTELTTGQYADALTTYEAAQNRHGFSLPVRWAGFQVLRANGRDDDAKAMLELIRASAERSPRRLEDVASRVAVGRAMLEAGTDAKQVLENYYDKAKKDDPSSAEPHLAAGELALTKHDYALAAEAFRDAVKRAPDDPDAHLGLARAFEEGDADRATAALAKALALNPKHPDALLFQADNLIDREAYEPAEWLLKQALEVNPKHPRAWAYRAVLAHLAGDRKQEEAHRAEALSAWKTNPEVDHLIGTKLSAKYRFAEGEAYQRRALQIAPDYRPANVQLCQDLLRLGKDEEGWRRAAEASAADPYDVVVFNLVTLHDTLSKYRTLKTDGFVVRMEEREADVYGDRVLQLLARAREKLVGRYGADLGGPVTIEIFPRNTDFAIRTFGLPGADGFLGVCFGPVVTVNSPASRAACPANWEAVLWHEFCHSVTLAKTKNKMPRWLSEGISVYEERRENPAWGQTMNPAYRELILEANGGKSGKGEGGEGVAFPTPVSKLSGAFLRPPSPMHLQFAYYESSMVVEYVVNRFGTEALQRVLTDLAGDVPINQALANHTEPIEKLDASFAAWLKAQAEQFGKDVDWTRPDLPLDAGSAAMASWNKEHPNNFWGLLGEGRALLAERKFKEAKAQLERAVKLYPTYGEAGGPYLLLAAAERELGDPKAERAMLEKHVALDADGIEPRLRLIEVAAAANDWPAVRTYTEQVLAVNPLVPAPHRYLAKAAEATGDRSAAIAAHRTLLALDPLDKAGHHYRLAKQLAEEPGQLPEARRQVVRALEEAPRYREAHRLLLEIVDKSGGPGAGPATRPATQPARD